MSKSYLTGANGVAEGIRRGRGVLLVGKKSRRIAELMESAEQNGVPTRHLSLADLDRLTSGPGHRGFALEVDGSASSDRIRHLDELWNRTGENSLVVLLDGITDPRNLGAVLRAADQFAADAVIVPRRRSAGADVDTMSRSSAGAIEWVNLIEVANLFRSLNELKEHGYWVWGAGISGEAVHRARLQGKTALVMGREGEGLHRLIKERCDGTVNIPTAGRIDSLNVATAAGILMYEIRRQQGFPRIG